jgi:hypothetical protein
MAISLGRHQYGKAEVRLVHIDRSTWFTRARTYRHQPADRRFAATHYTGSPRSSGAIVPIHAASASTGLA